MRLATGILAVLSAVFYAGVASAQSLIRDTEIEAMVRAYADPILVAANLPPATVRIRLIDDPRLNAFVTTERRMFLNTGIILESEFPNELKAVIAHEAGHLEGRHVARANEGARAAQLPLVVAIAAGIAAAAAGEGGAAAGLLASAQQFALLEYLQYSQHKESQADQAAVRYLEATGTSGKGLIRFFERFRHLEFRNISELDQINPYFRTHPISSDRVEALRAPVSAGKHYDSVDPEAHVDALVRAQAKILGYLHHDPDDIIEFDIGQAQLGLDNGGARMAFLENWDSTPALYARSVAHSRKGGREDTREAHRLIDELITREPDNPYFREVKAQFYSDAGDYESSIVHYEAAIELKPDAPLFHIALAASLIALNDEEQYQSAFDHLLEAEKFNFREEADNPYIWSLRARVYFETGDVGRYNLSRAHATAPYNLQCARHLALTAMPDLPANSPARAQALVILGDQTQPTSPAACYPQRGGPRRR